MATLSTTLTPPTTLRLFSSLSPVESSRCFCLEGRELAPEEFAPGLNKAVEFAATPDDPFFIMVESQESFPKHLEIICSKINGVASIGIFIDTVKGMDKEVLEGVIHKLAPLCVSFSVRESNISDSIFQIIATKSERLLDLEIVDSDEITVATLNRFATKRIRSLTLRDIGCLKDNPTLLESFGRGGMRLKSINVGPLVGITSLRPLIKDSLKEIFISGVCSSQIDDDLAEALKQPELKLVNVAGNHLATETYERLKALPSHISCTVDDCYESKTGDDYPAIYPVKRIRRAEEGKGHPEEGKGCGGGGGGSGGTA